MKLCRKPSRALTFYADNKPNGQRKFPGTLDCAEWRPPAGARRRRAYARASYKVGADERRLSTMAFDNKAALLKRLAAIRGEIVPAAGEGGGQRRAWERRYSPHAPIQADNRRWHALLLPPPGLPVVGCNQINQ